MSRDGPSSSPLGPEPASTSNTLFNDAGDLDGSEEFCLFSFGCAPRVRPSPNITAHPRQMQQDAPTIWSILSGPGNFRPRMVRRVS